MNNKQNESKLRFLKPLQHKQQADQVPMEQKIATFLSNQMRLWMFMFPSLGARRQYKISSRLFYSDCEELVNNFINSISHKFYEIGSINAYILELNHLPNILNQQFVTQLIAEMSRLRPCIIVMKDAQYLYPLTPQAVNEQSAAIINQLKMEIYNLLDNTAKNSERIRYEDFLHLLFTTSKPWQMNPQDLIFFQSVVSIPRMRLSNRLKFIKRHFESLGIAVSPTYVRRIGRKTQGFLQADIMRQMNEQIVDREEGIMENEVINFEQNARVKQQQLSEQQKRQYAQFVNYAH